MKTQIESMLDKTKDLTKEKLTALQEQSLEASKKTAKVLNQYAHRKPWILIGIIAVIAGLIGILLGRKSK